MRGKDADGDGHRDARCSIDGEADDCDDSHKAVYTGADEICDGLDNDCDSLADLDDGLALYGSVFDLHQVGGNPLIASSPLSRSYGILWEDSNTADPRGHVHFSRVSAGGTVIGEQLQVSIPGDSGEDWNSALALASGDDDFAVVYYQQSGTDPDLYFQRVGVSGDLVGPRVGLSALGFVSYAVVAQPRGGPWFVFWTQNERVWGAQISTGGVLQGTHMVGHDSGSHGSPVAARSGAQVAVAYADYSTGTVLWKRFTDSLLVDEEAEVAQPAGIGIMAGTDSEYGLAWSSSGALRFRTLSPPGSPTCDAFDLPTPATGGSLTGIASHAGGWLVTIYEPYLRNGYGYRRLIRVGSGCVTQGGLLELEPDTMYAAEVPKIAGGDAGYAVVWATHIDGIKHTRIRVFGPHLCDAPILE